MFIMKTWTTIKGKKYEHYKLVESYRENGKSKHRTIINFGNIGSEKAEQLKLLLSACVNDCVFVGNSDEIDVVQNFRYLDVEILHKLWLEWGFDVFAEKCKWLEALVLSRCTDSVSNINVKDWLSHTTLAFELKNKITNYNKFDVYRGLDHLELVEVELQNFIYNKICDSQKHNSVMYYDLTSSYFEGKTCVISIHGYSRDHRPDLTQIELALLINKEGVPYYWKVLEGNAPDVTTVKQMIDVISGRFGLKDCLFVFDRDMSCKGNLDYIEDSHYHFVTGLDFDEIRNIDMKLQIIRESIPASQYDQYMEKFDFTATDEDCTLYHREFANGNRRYIFSFDVARFLSDRRNRERAIEKVLLWIDKKNDDLGIAKKERDPKKTETALNALLKKQRLTKIIEFCLMDITVGNKNIKTHKIIPQIIEREKKEAERYDGIACFVTNVESLKLAPAELVNLYREKNRVEEAFRCIKSEIELRPIHVSREQRVRAHVTICVLAYLLINDLRNRINSRGVNISAAKFLSIMKTCMLHDIRLDSKKIRKITKVTDEQMELLKQMECDHLISSEYVKNLAINMV